MLPLLRVKTEYSFKAAYGPMERVADRLKAIECPWAAIVDSPGTWGHVAWQEALTERGIAPGFGGAFEILTEDGKRPTAWALAENLKAFYNFSSNFEGTEASFMAAPGVIRFAGAALTDPDLFDYVDLDHQGILAGKRALALAKKTSKPLALVPTNDYPAPEDHNRFMAWIDNARMTKQYILSDDELRAAYHWLDDKTFKRAYDNTQAIADRIGSLTLEKAPMIHVEGDLQKLIEQGKAYRLNAKHIKRWTKAYEDRAVKELKILIEKDYASYFLVVADLVQWAKQNMLVGPARGSAAGSLICYLLQITEIDPLKHDLIFERFIDLNRSDFPDIDIDFSDQSRPMVFDYLAEKYGANCVAKIGNVLRLGGRSVIAHVSKKLGINKGATFPLLNVLLEYSPGDERYGKAVEDTLKTTQPGREFLDYYPEGELIGELEHHASHSGVHAAGIIVSNQPVIDYCTVRDGVAHVDKVNAEKLNLLKIDALGLRTLGVIEDANCISAKELYGLPLDDPEVFKVFNDNKYAGLFQFEGDAQRRIAKQLPIHDFRTLDHITALSRPGPLGGGASDLYIARFLGHGPVLYYHKSMEKYLAETYGVVLYQEQVMQILREIGRFSWEDVTKLRRIIGHRKGKEAFNRYEKAFIKGARVSGIKREIALKIWDEIISFGVYGMNKSHTTSYAVISYWCAYLKRYHAVAFAAALLRNAKDDEQVIEMLRELNAEGIDYVPFDPDESAENWTAKNNKLYGGYQNLVGIGPVKAKRYIEKRDGDGLEEKDYEALKKLTCKFSDLNPAHTLYNDIYEAPDKYNIYSPVSELAELSDRENAVIVANLIRKERRDDNEAVRVARRGGQRKDGQTLFLDLFIVDDSISRPIRARIQSQDWFRYGKPLADRAKDKDDWFLIRGTWLDKFSMLSVEKIKPLNNQGIFE